MSRNLVLTKTFALLASSALLLSSIGCNPGTVTAPSSAPQTNVVDSPNFIRVLSTSKGVPEISMASAAEQVVSAEEGGTLHCGSFTLDIPAGALDQDTEITMDVINDGTLSVELGPHGIQFNVPVVLTMDLRGTSAEGMADQSSTLWHNEEEDRYERVQQLTSPDPNIALASLEHFSKYSGVIRP